MKGLFKILLALVVIVLVVGFWRSWFAFDTSTEGNDTNLTFSVDKEKLKEDVAAGKDAAVEAGRDAADAAKEVAAKVKDDDGAESGETAPGTVSRERVEGTVEEVASNEIVVDVGDEAVRVLAGPDTVIKLDGADAVLADLRAGDRVTVTLAEGGDGAPARRIRATRGG